MFIVIILMGTFLFIFGVTERMRNNRKLKGIKIRVNVNGIRGKSTATRLITAVLNEAGIKTMGKTTGTSARKIFPYEDKEVEIKRRPEGPNIKEQLRTISEASKRGVEALVCECMAVRPAYQDVYQNQMFHGNVVVIVNVLEDHLDEMGPSLNEIAVTFAKSIPYYGKLIIIEDDYTAYFKAIAKQRHTQVYVVDNNKIPHDYLALFDYVLFPDNVGIALAVAEALMIDETTALRGMLKATPDPGALHVSEVKGSGVSFTLANGFAGNEPTSSLGIWQYLTTLPINFSDPIVIFNGRSDRGDRTEQFAKDFFQHIPNATVIIMGQGVRMVDYFYDKGLYPNVVDFRNREGVSGQRIMEELMPIINGRVLFTVGNIHGDGEELLAAIEKITTEDGE